MPDTTDPRPSTSTSGNNALHLHILGSGSKGNCALVEGPQGLIMIDNGFSRKRVIERMEALGLSESDVRALVLTHEHSDHVAGIEVWCRRWEGPMFASAGTPAQRKYLAALPFAEVDPGAAFEVAGIHVTTFATSHDVVNPMGFRFECAGDAIGYVTDTGTLSNTALEALADTRILALESNHDVPMLRVGPYPRYLQDRIISDSGHLSNEQASNAARQLVTARTEHLVAMHISQENNLPNLAVRSFAAALGATPDNDLGSSATLQRNDGTTLRIRAAGQNRPITVL